MNIALFNFNNKMPVVFCKGFWDGASDVTRSVL